MTAELLTNPVECLLLEADNMVPEGSVTYLDVKLCHDGSAVIDLGIDAVDDDVGHIILQVEEGCISRKVKKTEVTDV